MSTFNVSYYYLIMYCKPAKATITNLHCYVLSQCIFVFKDDLADDDIMILDNGEQVFLWLGARCSEVEIKLAYKSAQVRKLDHSLYIVSNDLYRLMSGFPFVEVPYLTHLTQYVMHILRFLFFILGIHSTYAS